MENEPQPPSPLFSLGDIYITSNALAKLGYPEGLAALARHAGGDWGELCEEDREANQAALLSGARLLSAYWTGNDTKFWIITEADRSCTTILLPEDY